MIYIIQLANCYPFPLTCYLITILLNLSMLYHSTTLETYKDRKKDVSSKSHANCNS